LEELFFQLGIKDNLAGKSGALMAGTFLFGTDFGQGF
jgi:hypothetical protein